MSKQEQENVNGYSVTRTFKLKDQYPERCKDLGLEGLWESLGEWASSGDLGEITEGSITYLVEAESKEKALEIPLKYDEVEKVEITPPRFVADFELVPDQWCHPSVGWFDASNMERDVDIISTEITPITMVKETTTTTKLLKEEERTMNKLVKENEEWVQHADVEIPNHEADELKRQIAVAEDNAKREEYVKKQQAKKWSLVPKWERVRSMGTKAQMANEYDLQMSDELERRYIKQGLSDRITEHWTIEDECKWIQHMTKQAWGLADIDLDLEKLKRVFHQ